ncbi:MAG: amidohydrolase family protein [Dehalococcoidia bacterium]|nr:amidohydrolase family protein [Dehalococcoidia bacterium]
MPGLSLTGGRVWDGLADHGEAAGVAVADGLVAAAPPADAVAIDVTGCTVMPGLIEAHAHLCFNAGTDWRAVYDGDTPASMLLRMAGAARRMLDAGITTVRDLGAPTDLSVELRDALRAGAIVGPDLLVSGAPITTTGGHCWFMDGEADGELGVRIAVRERKRAGVDWIKVMASGGNMTPGSNPFRAQFSAAELTAVVEEAHRVGLRVAAHAHGVEGIRAAVEARVDTIEHCSFQTDRGSVRDDALVAEIAAREIIVSPTVTGGLGAQQGTERWSLRADLTRALFAAGARVVMSTDCGIPNTPHEDLGRAIQTLQRLADIPPAEALRRATSTSAELLGLPDRGVIQAGRRADLLVVEGDPTEDLEALQRVRLVVRAGTVVFRAGV